MKIRSQKNKNQHQIQKLMGMFEAYMQQALLQADNIKGPDISLNGFESFQAGAAITNDEFKDFVSQSDLFIGSSEGKEYLQDVIDCVQDILIEEKKSDKTISVNNIDDLMNKVIVKMQHKEIEKEKQEDEYRKQRINIAVKSSISEALKNVKPWEGLH